MRNILVMVFITLFLTTCSLPPKPSPEVPHQEPTEERVIIDTEVEEDTDKDTATETVANISREEMIRDIIDVWEMFFEDGNVKEGDPRRGWFEIYAGHVADAVITYQNTPVVIKGDSAVLPKHRSVHIMMAVIITKESSVTHDVVGAAPRFEVGLMQVWGVALNGYDRETVRNNPRLGVMLGVRWVTYMLSQCALHRMEGDTEGWRNSDWLRPLTMYGAKPKKVWKDRSKKICRVFPHARERVNLSQMYMERIDGERQLDLLL